MAKDTPSVESALAQHRILARPHTTNHLSQEAMNLAQSARTPTNPATSGPKGAEVKEARG